MLTIATAIGRAMTAVSTALILLLALPIAYEAVARAFGHPTIWVFETNLYAFIFLGFLGNVLAVQRGAHFRVMLVAELFGPVSRRVFDLVAHVSVLLFAVLIIASGLYYVWYSLSNHILSGTLLNVPLWIPELAVPLGGLGLFLQTLVVLMGGGDPHAHMDVD